MSTDVDSGRVSINYSKKHDLLVGVLSQTAVIEHEFRPKTYPMKEP